ncbi:hypothetical protein [Mesorhizobium sp. M7D.F.Ca.US.005.01.1.1]|uniref:hypothetical protein n=1 Tax=Mesorhizobium sp. M7D.F.Ca.US.005.01.1.1 TaxID=2493678 RepID=UPI001FE064A3|nr:hypothetical protein [Mesorhizobium sp. M7D.F.Ca.US.005.01.1.1]
MAMVLSSAEEEYPGCNLRVSAFGRTLIIELPTIIKPYHEKVEAKSWDAATIERLGRDWYWNIDRRQYGFTYSEGHLNIYLGRQTNDSSTTQDWGMFLPWTQWRHVRHSFYGLQGEHLFDEPQGGMAKLGGDEWRARWDAQQAREASVPTAQFAFKDFDGEDLTATTKIEEREWKFGTGRFKWLSLFRKPKIRRSLDLDFSGETGERKGSWKGGTMGHSIDMLPGELHESAFRRYCAANKMTFVGVAT